MKILVIGGSMFLGKCFVNMALGMHEITVLNRGNNPLNNEKIREIHSDRHNTEILSTLSNEHFDCVVDFCAYRENDIALIFDALNGHFSQYIYISTVDVYERGTGHLLNEEAPFEERDFGGQEGEYILGKVCLEKELRLVSKKYNTAHTSIRPAFIYGPDNYAPREGIYFFWIEKAGQIIHPQDADGEFQLVYVEDVARAILNSVGNEKAYNEAFNIAPLNLENYDTFYEALKEAVDVSFEKISVPLEMVYEKNIPLPFPLTKQESNFYDGHKSLLLINDYTSLAEGLKYTFSAQL